MARLSERQSAFVHALYARYGGEDLYTRGVNHDTTGLALKDTRNAAVLEALKGCVGRKTSAAQIGRLLEKLAGKRFGDLELVRDGEQKPGNRCRYYVKDHSKVVPVPPPPKPPRTLAGEIAQHPDLAVRPEDVAAIMKCNFGSKEYNRAIEVSIRKKEREEREDQHAEDMEKIKADPTLTDTFCKLTGRARLKGATRKAEPAGDYKCGPDGRPIFVPHLPPPSAAPQAPQEPEKAAPEKHGRAGDTSMDRHRPWVREKRQPTRAELVAAYREQQAFRDPGFDPFAWLVPDGKDIGVRVNWRPDGTRVNEGCGTLWDRTLKNL